MAQGVERPVGAVYPSVPQPCLLAFIPDTAGLEELDFPGRAVRGHHLSPALLFSCLFTNRNLFLAPVGLVSLFALSVSRPHRGFAFPLSVTPRRRHPACPLRGFEEVVV